MAKWTDRFFAWLIDFVLITFIAILISTSFYLQKYLGDGMDIGFEIAPYITSALMMFIYWTVLEYATGQSIGKRLLGLRVVSLDGGKAGLKGILLSSFGKSTLLPVDVITGLILTNEKRQRIFNKLGDTLVIKINKSTKEPSTD